MKPFTALAALFRRLGPLWLVLLVAAVLAPLLGYGLVFARLSAEIGWPEAYGFTCGRKCWGQHLWHSRKLLAGGSPAELALFATIWFVPAVSALAAAMAIARRRLVRRRKRIRPMQRGRAPAAGGPATD